MPKIAVEVKNLQDPSPGSSDYCSMGRLTAALGRFVVLVMVWEVKYNYSIEATFLGRLPYPLVLDTKLSPGETDVCFKATVESLSYRSTSFCHLAYQSAKLLTAVHSKDPRKRGPKPLPYLKGSFHLELVLRIWTVGFYLADMQRLVSLEKAGLKSRVTSNSDSDINVHALQPVSLAKSAQLT